MHLWIIANRRRRRSTHRNMVWERSNGQARYREAATGAVNLLMGGAVWGFVPDPMASCI